ncbi:MAG: site-specific integrase, partial [Proteobacteria bacterium]
MGIKNESNGTFTVSYVKRHPITNQPVTLRRKGIKTHAEAKRAHAKLVIAVEDKLRAAVVPTWSKVVQSFKEECKKRGHAGNTLYCQDKALESHTIAAWGKRMIDSITTTDVRNLLHERLGDCAQSHQKYFLRMVRG